LKWWAGKCEKRPRRDRTEEKGGGKGKIRATEILLLPLILPCILRELANYSFVPKKTHE